MLSCTFYSFRKLQKESDADSGFDSMKKKDDGLKRGAIKGKVGLGHGIDEEDPTEKGILSTRHLFSLVTFCFKHFCYNFKKS